MTIDATAQPDRPDVAVFIPSFVGGGAERLAFFLAEKIAEAGYRTDLVVARSHGELKDAPLRGVRKVELNAITELLALPAYLGYLRKNRPRLVLSMVHTATFTAAMGRALHRAPPVIIAVQRVLRRAQKDLWWVHRVFGFGPEKKLYKNCEKVLTVSHGLAREVEEVYDLPPASVTAIHNPLFSPPTHNEEVPEADEALFNRPVILAIGRLVGVKNFHGLIEAFAASAHATTANLVIIGEGPCRAELEQTAARLGIAGHVFLIGWRATPYPYLKRCRLFVSSSVSEGFGLVCLEALGAGAPLVIADCPHGPREIIDHGRYGTLVPINDNAALARGIEEELAKPAQSRTARLEQRQEWLAQFSPAIIAQHYVDEIAALIGPPAPL